VKLDSFVRTMNRWVQIAAQRRDDWSALHHGVNSIASPGSRFAPRSRRDPRHAMCQRTKSQSPRANSEIGSWVHWREPTEVNKMQPWLSP